MNTEQNIPLQIGSDMINFDEYIKLTNQLVKVFNLKDPDLVESSQIFEREDKFSFKNYLPSKNLKYVRDSTNQDVLNLIAPKPTSFTMAIPRQITILWFLPNEIEIEYDNTEGMFSGYVLPELAAKQNKMFSDIRDIVLCEESDTSALKIEFEEFCEYYSTHIQAIFEEFIYTKKTISLTNNINMFVLFDWIMLFSASFRSFQLFDIIYTNSSFPELYVTNKKLFFELFSRQVSSLQNSPSIIKNIVFKHATVTDTKSGLESFIEKYGYTIAIETIFFDTDDKNIITIFYGVYALIKLNFFKNIGTDQYGIISKFRTKSGKNFMHIVICIFNNVKYPHNVSDNLGTLFNCFLDLYYEKCNNDVYPAMYLVNPETITKLIELDLQTLEDFKTSYSVILNGLTKHSDTYVCALSPIINSNELKLNSEHVLKNLSNMFLNDVEGLINSIMFAKQNNPSNYLDNFGTTLDKLFTHMNREEQLKVLTTKIKIYGFDDEYPVFAILSCIGIDIKFPEVDKQYPFLFSYPIKTRMNGYKIAPIEFDENKLTRLIENKNYGPVMHFLDSTKKCFNFSANFYELLSKSDVFGNYPGSKTAIYYKTKCMLYNKNTDISNNFAEKDSEKVSCILYCMKHFVGDFSNSLILSLKNHYDNDKDIVTNLITSDPDWFMWKRSEIHTDENNLLLDITLDIIKNRKMRAIDLVTSTHQLSSILCLAQHQNESFLQGFCENKRELVEYVFENGDLNVANKLLELSEFDWKIFYNCFVSAFSIDTIKRGNKFTFVRWCFTKLALDDLREKFAHVLQPFLTDMQNIFSLLPTDILVSLIKYTVSSELYKNDYQNILVRVFNENYDAFISLITNKTQQEIDEFLDIKNFTNFDTNYIFVCAANYDAKTLTKILDRGQDFWNKHKKNIYLHLTNKAVLDFLDLEIFNLDDLSTLLSKISSEDETYKMMSKLFEKFKLAELLGETSTFTDGIYSHTKRYLKTFELLINKVYDENEDNINVLITHGISNDYILLEELCKIVEDSQFFCNNFMGLLTKCKSPELVSESVILKTLSNKHTPSVAHIMNEYVRLCVMMNFSIKCSDDIFKVHPSALLSLKDFKDTVSNLSIDTIISILRAENELKYPVITHDQQDYVLNYANTTMTQNNFNIVLKNINQITPYISNNLDIVIDRAISSSDVLQCLVNLNDCPKEIFMACDDNGDYGLMFVPTSKISMTVAQKFVSLLSQSDIISVNKRGNFKILHFLCDPYIQHILIRSDIQELFEDKKIGPIVFEELMETSIEKSFIEILDVFPENVRSMSDFTDSKGNNFYMLIFLLLWSQNEPQCDLHDVFLTLKQESKLKDILLHKNYTGENLLFLSVRYTSMFNKMVGLYTEILGPDSLMEADSSNQTLLMYAVRYNPAVINRLLENNNIKKNNNYVYVNTGSVLTHVIQYHPTDEELFGIILNWKNINSNSIDVTQQIQIFDWSETKQVKVNVSVPLMSCIFSKEIFKIILDLPENNVTKNTLRFKNKEYDIFETAYLYEPESFQYLCSSKHLYENFPSKKHKDFFLTHAKFQPASWFKFVNSKYYDIVGNKLFTQNQIFSLDWSLRPENMKHPEVSKYVQTKNEPATSQENTCEICFMYKKKIMYECFRHLTCVYCCCKTELCPVCKDEGQNRIKVFD